MVRHTSNILNKKWGSKDLVVRWMWRFQSIKKLKVLGWLLLRQGLPVKCRLHKIGVIDFACVLCAKDETMKRFF